MATHLSSHAVGICFQTFAQLVHVELFGIGIGICLHWQKSCMNGSPSSAIQVELQAPCLGDSMCSMLIFCWFNCWMIMIHPAEMFSDFGALRLSTHHFWWSLPVIVVIYYHYAICQPDLLLQPQSFGKISQNLHLHNFPKLTFPDFPTKVCLHTPVQSFTPESLPNRCHVFLDEAFKSGRQHPSPSNHQFRWNKTQSLLQSHQQITQLIQKSTHVFF